MARKKQGDLVRSLVLPPDFAEFLESLKARVRQAQTQAMLAVTRGLIRLYRDIGREIAERQEPAIRLHRFGSSRPTNISAS
jgi:hypothetical protein